MSPEIQTKILVAESQGFSTAAATILRQTGDLVLADLDRPSLLASLRVVDVLWIRLRHKIDAQVIDAAPHLKVIVTPTTGLNHIDLEETQRRGIRVLSLQRESEFLQDVRATAELTLGLILTLFRGIPRAATHVQHGGWERDLFKGNELYGKAVGIVGYGRLGRIVGRYVSAFDARVLATDPNLTADTIEPGITVVSLHELLQEADVVTLHVNLDQGTMGFFGREQFAKMKKGAWFVNTSRGELIDENALLHSLQSGHLRGAALDVLRDEHSVSLHNHPLVAHAREHDNLLITPHIGGCTVESMEKTELFLAEKLKMYISSFAS